MKDNKEWKDTIYIFLRECVDWGRLLVEGVYSQQDCQKAFDNTVKQTYIFIENLLDKERVKALEGKFFNKVEINEEINIPIELLEHIKNEAKREGFLDGIKYKDLEFEVYEWGSKDEARLKKKMAGIEKKYNYKD